eukprot:scaffold1265_cov366-Prasinococcus_capsulatus_cf.AAC.23
MASSPSRHRASRTQSRRWVSRPDTESYLCPKREVLAQHAVITVTGQEDNLRVATLDALLP